MSTLARTLLALALASIGGCASAPTASCTQTSQCTFPDVCAAGECSPVACVAASDCRMPLGRDVARCVDGRCEYETPDAGPTMDAGRGDGGARDAGANDAPSTDAHADTRG
jgi:hypothetical protein